MTGSRKLKNNSKILKTGWVNHPVKNALNFRHPYQYLLLFCRNGVTFEKM